MWASCFIRRNVRPGMSSPSMPADMTTTTIVCLMGRMSCCGSIAAVCRSGISIWSQRATSSAWGLLRLGLWNAELTGTIKTPQELICMRGLSHSATDVIQNNGYRSGMTVALPPSASLSRARPISVVPPIQRPQFIGLAAPCVGRSGGDDGIYEAYSQASIGRSL